MKNQLFFQNLVSFNPLQGPLINKFSLKMKKCHEFARH